MRRLIVLAALGLASRVAAQDPPPVFPVDLDMVSLSVTVRDDDGNPVPDLQAQDFAVVEDGNPQRTVIFAPAVEPGNDETLALDLGLMMDTSESMLKELRLSKEAAVRFLEAVPRARNLLTVFFDQDIRISRFDGQSQQGLFARIHGSQGGGMTALYDAIAVYLSRVEGSAGRKVLVLLTDGEDSASELSQVEALRLVRSSNVTIYPIALLGGFPRGSPRIAPALSFLQQLAALTGGEVFSPSSSRELGRIYGKIIETLSKQYVIGFSPSNTRRDGKFRRLRVEVSRKGLKVRHREGYYGPTEGT